MNLEMLLAIINKYGEDHILGFAFDNSGRKLFLEGEFSVDTHVDKDLECLVFHVEDTKGIPYNVLKPIDMIQTVYTIDNASDMNRIDRRYVTN